MLPEGLDFKEILTSSAHRNVRSRYITVTLVRDRCETSNRSSLTKLVKQKTTGHGIKANHEKNREKAIHRIVKVFFFI